MLRIAHAVYTQRATLQGKWPIYDRRIRRYPTPLEGVAGFEPAASRCAAGVLPKAPSARIAATIGGDIFPIKWEFAVC